jgi:DNA-directed RNA polymerase specialized sigma24 family protein
VCRCSFRLTVWSGQRGQTTGRAAAVVVGGDSEAAGKQPAVEADAAPISIQPAFASGLELGSPVPASAILANMDSLDGDEARRRHESLQRRLADQQLIQTLAEDNFAGRRYERFEGELAAYGISVLRGWMHSGYVFRIAAGRGFNLAPTEYELEKMVRDTDIREELANMTVALALPRFREQALVGGGWRLDGGASLPTYFMGACVYVFPNEFRKWRVYKRKYTWAARMEAVKLGPVGDPVSDPARLAVGNIRVLDELKDLDPRTAAVVAATMHGYSQEEIAELLELPSARTVEGILYRWRAKARPRERRGGDVHGG